MKIASILLAAAIALASSGSKVAAELRPAAIFGDNMVLQQQMPVPVWGWAAPGSKVTVTFAGQTQTTRAAADGKWLVKLAKLKASAAPQTLVITADETKAYTNVLVGEVWLGSGQSNMEKPIGLQPGQRPTFNAEAELAAAKYPQIRLFKVEKSIAPKPRAELNKYTGWRECSSNHLNEVSFSAAAYFFGRGIHTNLNVPVGLIESSWGGTRIEPWTPPAGFQSVPALAKTPLPEPGTTNISNRTPTALYNAMIAPIVGYALRGAIWYQGEANRSDTNYDAKMSALVNGWRQVWGEGKFPFYFVQLAPFRYSGKKAANQEISTDLLPRLWMQQARAARQISNAGMVVTTDLVDDLDDIHPRDKASVGHRLAQLALDETYEKEIPSQSPACSGTKVAGNKVILTFDNTYAGLVSKDGPALTWFTIAGADREFVPAEAKITGKNTVEVSAAGVARPVAVRFAWHELAQPNLFNSAGLPAEPFNTDMPVK